MNFWVRDKNSPHFHGPFTLSEITTAVQEGRVSKSSEMLKAEGQSYWALKRATGWRSLQDYIKTEPQALGAAIGGDQPIKEPAPRIFISYRREDSHDIVGRIYDRLVEYFTVAGVFKDIDDIPLGSDFRSVLDEAVGGAGAVLVIIGQGWVSAADAEGRRRLDSPTDFVRLEVQLALGKGLPVIPVLVRHARMPTPDELPDSLQQLPFRNGLSVRPDPDFNHDMERLASALEQWVSRPASARRPTVNHALATLAREREVERIDREWLEEREKYLVTVMKGQRFVDGQPTGGYPVREVPTRTGSIVGGIIVTVVSVIFAVVAGSLGGGLCAMVGVIIALVGIGSCARAFAKAGEYEAAEAAYRKRRASALTSGMDAVGGGESPTTAARPSTDAEPLSSPPT